MELKVKIQIERTRICLRDAQGRYSVMFFAAMTEAEARALLPQYGRRADEVVEVRRVTLSYPFSISCERVVAWVEESFRHRPGDALKVASSAHGVRRWMEASLPLLLPRGMRMERLPEALVETCTAAIQNL